MFIASPTMAKSIRRTRRSFRSRRTGNPMTEIVVVAHPAKAYPGAFELRTAADGFLLGIGRHPLACAAGRLLEEGHQPTDVVVIRDAAGQRADQRAKIKEALK